jgi:hypothetical protein
MIVNAFGGHFIEIPCVDIANIGYSYAEGVVKDPNFYTNANSVAWGIGERARHASQRDLERKESRSPDKNGGRALFATPLYDLVLVAARDRAKADVTGTAADKQNDQLLWSTVAMQNLATTVCPVPPHATDLSGEATMPRVCRCRRYTQRSVWYHTRSNSECAIMLDDSSDEVVFGGRCSKHPRRVPPSHATPLRCWAHKRRFSKLYATILVGGTGCLASSYHVQTALVVDTEYLRESPARMSVRPGPPRSATTC